MTEREFIEWMRDNFAERRSDVSEMCEEFLKNKATPKKGNIENRYIYATIPHTEFEIEYDTLTTELSFHQPLSQWKNCTNHRYYNDGEE